MKIFILLLLCLLSLHLPAQAPGVEDARLHIDQFGYLPSAQKIAVLASPQTGYNAPQNWTPDPVCRIKRCYDHRTVWQGPATAWNGGATHQQSGDKVWQVDFSSLTTNGNYYLFDSIHQLRSYPFVISDCAYANPLQQALHAFYYQRCGTAKTEPFAGADWADPTPCHVGNLQDLSCYDVQNPGPAGAKDLHGGWHDAGDYNKYVTFTYGPIMDLLLAYAENPGVWTDDMGIPESGNGIPDLLDELRYELDWLLRMQQADGSVLSVVGVKNFASASPPAADHAQRFYGPATTAATFSAASSFALAALQFQNIPALSAYTITLQMAAEKAWNWATAHPNATFYNSGVIAAGENQTDTYETGMRQLAASCYLFAQTGNSAYRNYFDDHYLDAHLMQWEYAYPFEAHTQDVLLFYSDLNNGTTLVKNRIRNVYAASVQNNNGDNLPSFLNNADAYRAYLRDDNYSWGSNETKCHQGSMFYLMNRYGLNSANSENYKNAASGFVHYLHGVNPTGYCFLSAMENYGAEFSVPSLYHGWFADGSPLDEHPAPGFLPGGPNPNYQPDASCNCLISPPQQQPIQKSYKPWNTGWPENSWEISEVAIYTQAAYLRLLSGHMLERQNPPSCDIELPVEITGNNIVCADGTYQYSVPEVPGSTYLWELQGGAIVSGQGTHSVFVLWNNSAVQPIITIHQTFP